jgi:hypothetical protein
MDEQTRGVKGLAASTANVTKQIKAISGANKNHLANASIILQKVQSVRELSAKRSEASASSQPGQAGESPARKKTGRPNGQSPAADSRAANPTSK